MSKLNYFLKGNTKIAYRYYKRSKKSLVFIHGLLSDMNGKKSTYFNNYCRRKKISFLCFDFQGHGKSNGDFVNFGIGDWFKNLKDLLNFLKIENIEFEGNVKNFYASSDSGSKIKFSVATAIDTSEIETSSQIELGFDTNKSIVLPKGALATE